ncbi:hypothetical protein [Microvirga antarctica]|uniref:hypothetical protein n=1 Tax=Microvirga antarctica TaxID=2819233 RepID=UPI001B316F64|nr:hypothetical protein [Microvirga antarctica]
MNPTAFGAQDAMVPPVAGFFVKLFASHPRHTRRVEAVGQWLGQAQAGAVSPAAEQQAA